MDAQSIVESLAQGFIPTVVLVVIGLLQQRALSRQAAGLERLKTALAARSSFFERRLSAHEQVWPLVAATNRAQQRLSATRQRGEDLAECAAELKHSRDALKNFVYDRGLYFDDEVRHLVQELDTKLADRHVFDVSPQIRALEVKLRRVVEEMTTPLGA